MEIKVFIPHNNRAEIEYTIRCLLEVFLGLKCSFIIHSKKDFHFHVGTKKLVVENALFTTQIDKLNLSHIPSVVSKGDLKIKENTFPICSLYGVSDLSLDSENIYLKSDIVASTFFMLSRWEEKINPARDNHNRFPANQSVACKFNLIDRAIVNEYVELLWAIIKKLGYKGKRSIRKFKIIPTHDVDHPFLWYSPIDKFGYTVRTLLKFRLTEVWKSIKCNLKGSDPFDNHGLFMNLAEESGAKAYFFFLVGGNSKYDARHDFSHPKIQSLLTDVKDSMHVVALHPSYASSEKKDLLKSEKKVLEDNLGQTIIHSRQHYLRLKTPDTWRVLQENGIKYDFTLGYAERSGFRCGVCYPFPLFDFENKEVLEVYEWPLIVMEVSLASPNYENLTVKAALSQVRKLKKVVKSFDGNFVFLWHNSSFHIGQWDKFKPVLKEMYAN